MFTNVEKNTNCVYTLQSNSAITNSFGLAKCVHYCRNFDINRVVYVVNMDFELKKMGEKMFVLTKPSLL
jgi:hypothetical protein